MNQTHPTSDSLDVTVFHPAHHSSTVTVRHFSTLACSLAGVRYRPVLWLVAAILLSPIFATPLRAEVDMSEALKSIRHNSWYDATAGEYKPPVYTPIGDVELRDSGWKAKVIPPKAPAPAKTRNWNSNFNWNADFISEALTVLVILLLAVGVVAVVLYALKYNDDGTASSKKKATAKKITVDAARMIDLPFNVDETPSDPLEACYRLMAAGDFNRAILYLYSYQLLALEQSSLIRLSKGKTNRMYLGELGLGTPLAKILSRTIHCFEAVYFGKHQLTAEQFQRVWGQLDEFHQQVAVEGERRTTSKRKEQEAIVPGGATA